RLTRSTPLPLSSFDDAKSSLCAVESSHHERDVHLALARRELGCGTFASLLGSSRVDLVRALGSVGEDDDLVVVYLEEAAGKRHVRLRTRLAEGQRTRHQRRHQRGVLRQDRQLTFAARERHGVYAALFENDALRRDDLQR